MAVVSSNIVLWQNREAEQRSGHPSSAWDVAPLQVYLCSYLTRAEVHRKSELLLNKRMAAVFRKPSFVVHALSLSTFYCKHHRKLFSFLYKNMKLLHVFCWPGYANFINKGEIPLLVLFICESQIKCSVIYGQYLLLCLQPFIVHTHVPLRDKHWILSLWL